jgi:hypothetical protein
MRSYIRPVDEGPTRPSDPDAMCASPRKYNRGPRGHVAQCGLERPVRPFTAALLCGVSHDRDGIRITVATTRL